jgi:hypothetical protein
MRRKIPVKLITRPAADLEQRPPVGGHLSTARQPTQPQQGTPRRPRPNISAVIDSMIDGVICHTSSNAPA